MGRLVALYREAYRDLPPEIWRLALVAFINRSGTMVVPFLVLWLTGERGFTTAEAGLFLTLYGVGALAGTYLGGWASDRVTPRRLQIGSLAASGVLFFLLGTCHGALPIGLTLVSVAVAGEAFRPANATSLTRWSTPEVRSRSFALRRLAVNLGMTFGPAAGGFLALYSYTWLFALDGATCLFAAVAMHRMLGDEPRPEPEVPQGDETPTRSPWRDGPFLVFLGLLGLITLVVFQFATTWPLTLRDLYGMPENRIGLLLAVNTLLIVAFEMVLIHAVQELDPVRVMAVGTLLLGGGFALLPFGSSFGFASLTVVVWTVGEMLTFPLSESVTATRAGLRNPGSYLGLFATTFGLSFTVAQALGPWIYQIWGPRTLWLAGGMLLLPPRMRSSTGRPVRS
jgi:predicted MFS family arabinose efflux permease